MLSEKANHFDVIIIGGGAAGLFCAGSLPSDIKVALIEHNKAFGRKILISGGGRCNFTNIHTSPENFHGKNPHYHKSALSRFLPYDFVDLVEKADIAYYEKTLGQLFCRKSSKEIVKLLLDRCEEAKTHLMTSYQALEINQRESSEGFCFELITQKETFYAKKIVIASGGLPLPSLGASDFGLKMAKKLEHRLIEQAPALVPLTLDLEHGLSGVSVEVIVSTDQGPRFREALLFTHKGLSGPAILQISSYWRPGKWIEINFLPDIDFKKWFEHIRKEQGSKQVKNLLRNYLPVRFLEAWGIDDLLASNVADLSKAKIEKLENALTRWRVYPSGTEGHRKAEVMRGGVDVNDLNSKTMESKKVAGLYFIGEVVDVTGHLGGFNFQWAWASGYACAQALKNSFLKD